MRGRLPLLVPLTLLALLPPGPGTFASASAEDDDPCINLEEAAENPRDIINIAQHCTLIQITATAGQYNATLEVTVTQLEDGLVIVTIVLGSTDDLKEFVLTCAHPNNWPRIGDGGLYVRRECWVDTTWMN